MPQRKPIRLKRRIGKPGAPEALAEGEPAVLAYGGKLTLFIGDGQTVFEVARSDTTARLEALEAAVAELKAKLEPS